jgi:protein-disulfide isomerase
MSAGGRRSTVPQGRLVVPVDDRRDHVQGDPRAPVTLVEYGDYQCPYCGEAYPIVKRIQATLGAELRFVFRNFPLTQAHPNAQFGAELAEAGGAQGRFWEAHDLIYENQDRLRQPERFAVEFAERLDIDRGRVERELAEHTHLDRIRDDFMGGVHSGVNGTPTFYINDQRHDDSYEYETLLGAIRRASGTRAKRSTRGPRSLPPT